MNRYIGTIIFSAIGSVFMTGAVMKIIGNIFFLRLSQKAIGTVVYLKTARVRSRRSHNVYLPVIEFEPVANHKIRITATVGSNPPDYQIGDTLTVRFLPKRPGGGKIHSFWEMWFLPALFFTVGAAVFGTAILLFLN
ncbi:MAG TPA: DUF3592 domain-containing protein [Pyrinomonadaceae bacterium]|jgi:hypothetical protein